MVGKKREREKKRKKKICLVAKKIREQNPGSSDPDEANEYHRKVWKREREKERKRKREKEEKEKSEWESVGG